MQKNNFILGDIFAVKEKGLDYLIENYYWPVSNKEFKEFVNFSHGEYLKIINSIDDKDVRNIAIVELSFVAQLQQILHYNYVKNSVNNDLKLVTSQSSQEFYHPNWELISQYYISLNPVFGMVRRFLRRIIKNILFNRHLSIGDYIHNFIHGSDVIGVGSFDNLKREFIINKNIFCDHMDWIDLYSKKITDSDSKLVNIRRIIKHEIVAPYLSKLKNTNSKFTDNIDFTLIQKSWDKRFSDAAYIYLNVLKNKKKSVVLVVEIAKPIHKLITVAYQEMGSSVYCFHHGHDTAVTINSVGHDITSAHCLKYVVPSRGIATKYKKVYPHLTTKYFSTESNWYKQISQKYLYKPSYKINKIMLMGFPFNSTRYVDGESNFFYSRVDLEYRLIVFLKKHGYSIIYKAHPDRLSEAHGLYDCIVDEIISEPFESVVHSADCFLFTHSSSTTFGYALLTNKPIFLIDINSNFVDHNSHDLLKKRVNMVPSFAAKSTRIIFDKESILNVLSKPTNNKYDDSYIRKMFFPGKIE